MGKTNNILDGKALAQEVREEVAIEVAKYRAAGCRAPGLGVILVGEDPASQTYVANKEKAARSAGFETFDIKLPEVATQKDVERAIQSFNENPGVDGILLQLPLPKHLDSNALIALIRAAKDADGLHPENQGFLMRGTGKLRPCTPLGVMKILEKAGVELRGKNAIVVGRSILVGRPVALMLLEKDATVTIAHSKTKDLAGRVRAADVVIAAVGVPELLKGDWIQDGAVVIDVGINRLPDGKLVGDVHFESAKERASLITPVPGGVGPMTIAMLISNTFTAYMDHV